MISWQWKRNCYALCKRPEPRAERFPKILTCFWHLDGAFNTRFTQNALLSAKSRKNLMWTERNEPNERNETTFLIISYFRAKSSVVNSLFIYKPFIVVMMTHMHTTHAHNTLFSSSVNGHNAFRRVRCNRWIRENAKWTRSSNACVWKPQFLMDVVCVRIFDEIFSSNRFEIGAVFSHHFVRDSCLWKKCTLFVCVLTAHGLLLYFDYVDNRLWSVSGKRILWRVAS